MARYINEDEFIAWVKEHWCSDCQNDNGLRGRACWIDDAIDIVEEAPEADVVPRAEAENYKSIAETQQKLSMDRYFEIKQLKSDIEQLQAEKDALIKNYFECMKDYAREIFEEIEYNFGDLRKVEYANAQLQIVFNLLDYLKKKYTEGENG